MNANQVIEIIENAISAECDGEALYGNFHDVAKRIFLDLLNKGFLTEGNEKGSNAMKQTIIELYSHEIIDEREIAEAFNVPHGFKRLIPSKSFFVSWTHDTVTIEFDNGITLSFHGVPIG